MRSQILRQSLVISGLVICSITNGFIFGQMSGMLADLHINKNSTGITDDEISWIASSINVTSVCGFAFAACLTEKVGRRRAFTGLALPIVANWILLYYADGFPLLMISRIIVGVCFGGVLLMNIISTGEYTSPNNRAFYLNMITSVGPAVGTALGHVFGLLYHWRIVSLIGIIPTALGALLPCFWVESPSWLASKGKFEECDKAFRSLHGHRPGAEVELQLLTELEKCKLRKMKEIDSNTGVNKLLTAAKRKYFWHLLLLSCVINVYVVAAGKLLFSTLAITMLQEITGSPDILLFTLIVDGFSILGSCLSCVLIKRVSMRGLLFSTGIVANILLIILSACLYFKPEKDLYFPWINSILLGLYFIVVNAGPYPVLEALMGEIFPLELKAYCFFLSGIVLGLLLFLSLKTASFLFATIGYHGVFLLNTGVMSICLLYVWIRLPETKGRTMQEIEMYFKNNKFDKVEDLINGEQIKILI
ncbi:unnamed protein product, partial [Iphiclides podalirius]